MLNRQIVLDRISLIRRSANRLRKMIEVGKVEFTNDDDHFAIAEHHLRRAIEAILDIGRYIISKKGLAAPGDYTSILDTLAKNKILPPEFAQKIRGMAGYRNRLVHLYVEVTNDEIFDIIENGLEDLELFCVFIIEYLDKEKV